VKHKRRRIFSTLVETKSFRGRESSKQSFHDDRKKPAQVLMWRRVSGDFEPKEEKGLFIHRKEVVHTSASREAQLVRARGGGHQQRGMKMNTKKLITVPDAQANSYH